MIESINIIKQALEEYIGTGAYMTLFLLSLIYIYKKVEKKEIRNFILFSVIIFILILNPIFCKVILKFIGSGVYWRMFWVLPMGIVIAYVGTDIILKSKKGIERIIIGVAIVLIIILGGKCVFNDENFTLATNWYKIPQETLAITSLISEDDENDKCLLAPVEMVAYVRQYDPSIYMMVQRIPDTYENEPVVASMESGDVDTVLEKCKTYGANYVVFRKTTIEEKNMDNYNINKIGETVNYVLYKINQ
jgi:hypothetical protein